MLPSTVISTLAWLPMTAQDARGRERVDDDKRLVGFDAALPLSIVQVNVLLVKMNYVSVIRRIDCVATTISMHHRVRGY